jgi:hypothetical protein
MTAWRGQGIERISLGRYKVGAILLTGLFFYDIFWVFGTDVSALSPRSSLLYPPASLSFPYSRCVWGGLLICPLGRRMMQTYTSLRKTRLFFYDIFWVFGTDVSTRSPSSCRSDSFGTPACLSWLAVHLFLGLWFKMKEALENSLLPFLYGISRSLAPM